jgi:hypothetical protein
MAKKLTLLFVAAVTVLSFSSQSWAYTDFEIGGNVQLETSWRFDDVGDLDDKDATGTPQPLGTGFDDTTNFNNFLLSSSRLKFRATVGDVTGYYEIGFGSGSRISTRKAYAEWDAGGFLLLFGRHDGVVAYGDTDQQLDSGAANQGFGNLYDGRNDQLRITIPGETFTFKGALYQARGQALALLGNAVDTEAPIPALAANVSFKPTEMLTFTPSGYFQTYELLAPPPAAGAVDYDGEGVDTWAFAVDGRVDLESFYFAYELWYGENLGSGGFTTQPLTGAQLNAVSGKIEDVTAYGGFVRFVWPMETMRFLTGIGAEVVDWDDLDQDLATPATAADDNTVWAGYVAVIYNFTDNFWMQPEISYFDQGNNRRDVDLGHEIWVGVHWQADF